MHTSVALLLELGIVLVILSVLGTLARRASFSPVPLYLLAGLFLGEGGLVPIPVASEFLEVGAAIGIVLLLLLLGLEFSASELASSLRRHVPSAGLDLVLNSIPGAVAGWLLGLDSAGILALAGAAYISSSGIAARMLTDLGRLGNRETPAVLSVLVLEDFVMAAYLPVLVVIAAGGAWWQAVIGVLLAVGAVLMAFAASYRLGRHLAPVISHPDPEQLMFRVLGLTLIVAALAELVYVSAAVGAFLVGLALSGEVAKQTRVILGPLRDFFAATFFVAIGLSVGPMTLLPVLPAAIFLALISIVAKLVTGWYAASRDAVGKRGRVRAGAALIAHGEFSIVIVGLVGGQSGVLGPLVIAYVLILAVVGPLMARLADSNLAAAMLETSRS